MIDVLKTASKDHTAFPLWMLFNVAILKTSGSFQESLPFHRDEQGNPFASVFSDKDLAERYVEENPLDPCEVMPIEDKARLCYVLRLYQQKGVCYVGADFSSRQFGQEKRFGQTRTIEIFIAECEAEEEETGDDRP